MTKKVLVPVLLAAVMGLQSAAMGPEPVTGTKASFLPGTCVTSVKRFDEKMDKKTGEPLKGVLSGLPTYVNDPEAYEPGHGYAAPIGPEHEQEIVLLAE